MTTGQMKGRSRGCRERHRRNKIKITDLGGCIAQPELMSRPRLKSCLEDREGPPDWSEEAASGFT